MPDNSIYENRDRLIRETHENTIKHTVKLDYLIETVKDHEDQLRSHATTLTVIKTFVGFVTATVGMLGGDRLLTIIKSIKH